MKKSDAPVVIVQVFDTSAEILWNALTNHQEMIRWFFDNIEGFKPEIGFETSFLVQSENRSFTHLWKITEVIPFQKITYNWKYEEYPGNSYVTFELFEEIKHVKLRLSMEIVEDFPDEIPEFTRESCIAGWNYFIGGKLKEYLESQIN